MCSAGQELLSLEGICASSFAAWCREFRAHTGDQKGVKRRGERVKKRRNPKSSLYMYVVLHTLQRSMSKACLYTQPEFSLLSGTMRVESGNNYCFQLRLHVQTKPPQLSFLITFSTSATCNSHFGMSGGKSLWVMRKDQASKHVVIPVFQLSALTKTDD